MDFKRYSYGMFIVLSAVILQSHQTDNSTNIQVKTNETNSSNHVIATEGGSINNTVPRLQDSTHLSREHVTSNPKLALNVTKQKAAPIPVHNDTKLNATKVSGNATVVEVTTTVPKPRKPLKTVHDDDVELTKSESPPLKISSMDPTLNSRKVNRANYVVPIVAVILSVPLVSFLISVLYKRSKDWWLHRNYRRMDYLIEGLYNS